MATTPKTPAAKKAAAKNSVSAETKLVQDLADILDKAGLAELEYETETVAIRLSRVAGSAPVAAVAPTPYRRPGGGPTGRTVSASTRQSSRSSRHHHLAHGRHGLYRAGA